MGILRHSKEQIAEYHANTAMNQSSLEVIAQAGMEYYLAKKEEINQDEEWYDEKIGMKLGSAVDFYLSHGRDAFNAEYFFSDKMIATPTGATLPITRKVFDVVLADFKGAAHKIDAFETYRKVIRDVCDDYGYYAKRRKDDHMADNRYKELLKGGAATYFEELKLSGGKTILSEAEGELSTIIAKAFIEHPYTANYFKDDDLNNCDYLYQVPLYFDIEGTPCKALIDKIIILHAHKRIIPIDFKTTGRGLTQFPQIVREYRYDIQGSFYLHGLRKCLRQLNVLTARDVEQYQISKFAFFVQSTVNPGLPLIFIMKDEMETQGEFGDGRRLQGWRTGFNRFKLWEKYGFSLEERMKEHNGITFVDQFFESNVDF